MARSARRGGSTRCPPGWRPSGPQMRRDRRDDYIFPPVGRPSSRIPYRVNVTVLPTPPAPDAVQADASVIEPQVAPEPATATSRVRYVIGVDLGGTNIVCGAMPEDGSRQIA